MAPEFNVDPDHIHLVLNRQELLVLIDALLARGGHEELVERFQSILRQIDQDHDHDRWWTT